MGRGTGRYATACLPSPVPVGPPGHRAGGPAYWHGRTRHVEYEHNWYRRVDH